MGVDITTVDGRKALAIEAFENGEYAEAEQTLQSLETIYAHFGHDDGLLAIGFNRFLVALEEGNRARTTELMAWLAESIEIHRDSPVTYEIADRIFRLFSEPCPGVDHEATAALVAITSEVVARECIAPNRRIDLSSIPELDAFAQFCAPEAALRVMQLVNDLSGRSDVPNWVRRFGKLTGDHTSASESVISLGRAAAEAIGTGDAVRAYRFMIEAQTEACQQHLPAACELACALMLLESRGLPKKLAFSPSPPQEERQALAAELYLVLGRTALETGRAGRLAERFLDAAVTSCHQTIEWIAGRHKRGAHRSADAERLARLATIEACTERMRGRLSRAADVLAASLGRAERGAFGNPMVTIGVLEEAARIYEQLGDLNSARRCFESALLGAVPGFTETADSAVRANAVNAVVAHAGRILHGVRALAGMARTGGENGRSRALERAREIIALSADYIRGPVLAQAQLDVALTGARFGESASALVALEAARVLGEPSAVALALYYWSIETSESETDGNYRASITLLSHAIAALKSLEYGPFRMSMDCAVARLLLMWGQKEDGPRVEAHLRRMAEGVESEWGPGLDWQFGVYLEGGWEDHFHRLLPDLASSNTYRLAGRFLRAKRQHSAYASGDEEHSTVLSSEAIKYVEERWMRVERGHTPPLPLPCQPYAVEQPTRVFRVARPGECLVELCEVADSVWVAASNTSEELAVFDTLSRTDIQSMLASLDSSTSASEYDQCLSNLFEGTFGPLRSIFDGARRLYLGLPLWASRLAQVFSSGQSGRLGVAMTVRVNGQPEIHFHDASRIAICGDATTGLDLQLSRLEAPNLYQRVSVHYGDALAATRLGRVMRGAQSVYLVGEVDKNGMIELRDGEVSVSTQAVAEALSVAQVHVAAMMGPVPAHAVHRVAQELLQGVSVGVLMRITPHDDNRQVPIAFFREAVRAQNARDVIDAWGRTIAHLKNDGCSLRDLNAYVLFVSESA